MQLMGFGWGGRGDDNVSCILTHGGCSYLNCSDFAAGGWSQITTAAAFLEPMFDFGLGPFT